MPARWLSLGIVAFWLGTNGWLLWREVWPQLRSGQPPPYTIDLVEEVQERRLQTVWTVTQDGREVFQTRTQVQRLGPDAFELLAEYTRPRDEKYSRATAPWGVVLGMESRYRLSAAGSVQGISVDVKGAADLAPDVAVLNFTSRIRAEVRGGKFTPTLEVTSRERPWLKRTLPEADAASGGWVFLPLQPVNRIRGLRAGQRWQVLVLDPLAASLGGLMQSPGGPHYLSAHVAARLERYTGGKRRGAPCLVIEYAGEIPARTWVEQSTGLVLRQEATLDGKRWVLNRD
jgi:hypothetical protein